VVSLWASSCCGVSIAAFIASGRFRLAAFVHSAVAGLTAIVLALAAILIAVVAVEILWSKVRDVLDDDAALIFRFVSAVESCCVNSFVMCLRRKKLF
jgi:hypothetical protein